MHLFIAKDFLQKRENAIRIKEHQTEQANWEQRSMKGSL